MLVLGVPLLPKLKARRGQQRRFLKITVVELPGNNTLLLLLLCSIRVSISELIKLTYSLRLSRKKEQVSARKRNAHRASKQNKKQKKETRCKKEQVNARKHSAHQASQSQKRQDGNAKLRPLLH